MHRFAVLLILILLCLYGYGEKDVEAITMGFTNPFLYSAKLNKHEQPSAESPISQRLLF